MEEGGGGARSVGAQPGTKPGALPSVHTVGGQRGPSHQVGHAAARGRVAARVVRHFERRLEQLARRRRLELYLSGVGVVLPPRGVLPRQASRQAAGARSAADQPSRVVRAPSGRVAAYTSSKTRVVLLCSRYSCRRVRFARVAAARAGLRPPAARRTTAGGPRGSSGRRHRLSGV